MMLLRMSCRSVGLAVALLTTTVVSATAQAPLYGSIEGGVACSSNKSMMVNSTLKLGDNGCGGTGAVEIGRTGAPLLSVFDHWALRGRFTTFDDKVIDGANVRTFDDRRTVIDAELGAKTPFGLFGGTSRIVVGLRYASWRGFADNRNAAGISVDSGTLSTTSVGPRIGFRSSIPLGSRFLYESNTGVAAMFGRHREAGPGFQPLSSNNTVISVDSSSALSYKMDGTDTGTLLSVGLFSEYWFGQINVDEGGTTYKRDRHSWGPFVRLRMPLQK